MDPEPGQSDKAPGPVLEFHRPGRKLALELPSAAFGLLFLGMTLSGGVLWWARVLAGLAFVALAILMWRVAGLGIYAGPGDLVIRNLRNTHRIRWHQVEDICVGTLPGQEVGLLVRLKEGSQVSATLYDSRVFRSYQPRRQVVAQLSELWISRSGADV